MSGHTRKRPVAKGTPHRGGRLGIVVYLDPDVFDSIRKLAEAGDTSFGEQVRILIEWGLEAATDT